MITLYLNTKDSQEKNRKTFNASFHFDETYLKKNKGATKRIEYWIKAINKPIPLMGFLAPFTITAPQELIKTGYDCGFGVNNTAGFGMGQIKTNYILNKILK